LTVSALFQYKGRRVRALLAGLLFGVSPSVSCEFSSRTDGKFIRLERKLDGVMAGDLDWAAIVEWHVATFLDWYLAVFLDGLLVADVATNLDGHVVTYVAHS
jgi:hypothetical protein